MLKLLVAVVLLVVVEPAAFRRLCVETRFQTARISAQIPAAFRRLCVETVAVASLLRPLSASRLQAAVC